MLYNKINLDVAKIACKNGFRPSINGVYFTDKKTVATDSYRLLEITVPADCNAEDYPTTDGMSAMRGCKPFIVPAGELKKIVIPKNKELPICENVAIKHIDDNRVEFLTTDITTANTVSIGRIKEEFPNYEEIFPTSEPVDTLVINAEYLIGLLEGLKKLGGSNNKITIKTYGNDKPIVLEADNGNQKGRAMLMQIKE